MIFIVRSPARRSPLAARRLTSSLFSFHYCPFTVGLISSLRSPTNHGVLTRYLLLTTYYLVLLVLPRTSSFLALPSYSRTFVLSYSRTLPTLLFLFLFLFLVLVLFLLLLHIHFHIRYNFYNRTMFNAIDTIASNIHRSRTIGSPSHWSAILPLCATSGRICNRLSTLTRHSNGCGLKFLVATASSLFGEIQLFHEIAATEYTSMLTPLRRLVGVSNDHDHPS